MYTTLDNNRRQIRLASILPGRWSEDVSCTLTVVSLSDKPRPRYEALSYTWGDLSDKVPIYLEGSFFPVTKNLHLALRRLRHVDKPRRMWVDALCINQSDSKLSLRPSLVPANSCPETCATEHYLGASMVQNTRTFVQTRDVLTSAQEVRSQDKSG